MRSIIIVIVMVAATNFSVGMFKSCGAANCPLNTHRYLNAGFLELSLTHEYINQDRVFVGSSPSFVGAIPEHHDEVQTLNERNVIQAQFGLSDRLGAAIDIPFIHREHSHIAHEFAGDAWETWNFSGLGDITLSGEYALIVPTSDSESYLSLSAGLKIPSGVTDAMNAGGE